MDKNLLPINNMITYTVQALPVDIVQTENGIKITFDKEDVEEYTVEELNRTIEDLFPPHVEIDIELI